MGKRWRLVLVTIVLLGVTGFVAYDKTTGDLRNKEEALRAPVNKEASLGAKKLLKFLYKIKGEYTLAGQHSYLEGPDQYANKVKQLTGDNPAIKGYELGGILDQSPEQLKKEREKVVKSAIAWHRAGGYVTMTYHVHLPGACYCWDQVNNGGISEKQFNEIITPGTESYKKHLNDLDDAAVYLKQLRDAGVPVLWRPYHEMNGNWFWWGNQPEFAKLWDLMYERFTTVHKLNNLLWVWSPSAPDEWAAAFEPYYVGADKVDVLAVDIYHNNYKQEHHDQLTALAGSKPIAIGENGHLPDPKFLKNEQKNYVWFMTWGKELENTNSKETIQSLYAQQRILNHGKMIELQR